MLFVRSNLIVFYSFPIVVILIKVFNTQEQQGKIFFRVVIIFYLSYLRNNMN